MFHRDNINGDLLKEKQLCLTFDDGPGIYTLPIAEFLNTLNIRATFFVVGKYAENNLEILKNLNDLGHIVANHTYEHPDLPYYCSINGDVQDQIIRTNALIKPYVSSSLIFFRAPYGKWSPELADELNCNLKSTIGLCGPIHWEIPGIDCHFWNIGKSVDEAVQAYQDEIKKVGKGIVVMHDEIADMDIVKAKNKTLELVKILIPQLLNGGYTFVGLDQIEGLQKQESLLNSLYIKTASKRYICREDKSFFALSESKRIEFNLVEHHNGKVSLKSPNNLFLSVNEFNLNEVFASNIENQFTLFDYIPVRNERFMLRSFNGNYLGLAANQNNKLTANAQFMRQATVFKFVSVHAKIERKISIAERMLLIKKAFLFVKSKLVSR